MDINYQTVIMKYLTTGNMFIDVFISGFLIALLTKFNENINYYINYIMTNIQFKKFSNVSISGKIIITKNLTTKEYFSDNFKSLRHYVFNSLKTNKNIKNIQEIFLGNEEIYDQEKELFVNRNDYKFLASDSNGIEIYRSIFYKIIERKKRKEDDDKSLYEINYEIILYTKYDITYITDFLEKCNNEYTKFIEKQTIPNLLYIKYDITDYDDLNNSSYLIYPYNSSKTFNTIYCDNKQSIISSLDFFINNKKDFIKKGRPYNLGYIFYGEPGCGKTSTIKAIANYTQRHIIEIPLSKIKTSREFEKIFFNTKFNKYNISQSKLLYVLEDFDTESDILFSRQYKLNDIEEKEKENIKKSKKKSDNNDVEENKLTLGSILNTLDGVLERHNQIVIFTTNHLEKLDKALIRPGRFDMIIEFKKASTKIIEEMYENYYNENINIHEQYSNKFTPAEIINMFQNNNKEYISNFFNN
jgi:hypothetical protein